MVKYLDNNSGFAQWNAAQDAKKTKSRLGGFLWWFLIFVASWLALNMWLGPRKTNVAETPVADVIDVSAVPTSQIDFDNISGTVQGLRIYDIKLKNYTISASDNTPVALLNRDNNWVEVGLVASGTVAPNPATVWRSTDSGMTYRAPDGVEFVRNISADGYVVKITDTVRNNTTHDITVAPYGRIVRDVTSRTSSGVYTGAVVYANSDLEHRDWYKLDKKSYAYTTTSGFVGFADQYWETLLSVNAPDQTMRVKKVGENYDAATAASAINIAPGATSEIVTHIYAGPRDATALATAATTIPGADKTIDYGWFWFLAMPMLWLLNIIHSFVANYGLAIIILTIILRLAIWPLTRKSYTSMIAMQRMQPEMQRIQKLYANDKMRMQMEMMKLYRTHKTSPMSGCLPMLLQIPIFFALYKALLISVPMRNAAFLWISDLASRDPFFVLPILMGLTMWLTQKLQTVTPPTNNANDITAQTQRFMRWMPVIFTIMFAWMPAGLVLYWTVSNVFGIAQMQLLKHNSK